MKHVGDLGGVGVAGEREAASGERELGRADGGDAEHGQVGGTPLVVGAALAAVCLLRLPRGQIHRHRAEGGLAAGDSRGAAREDAKPNFVHGEESLGDNTLDIAQQFSDVSAKRILQLFTYRNKKAT